MSDSKTLKRVLTHWTSEFPANEGHIDLPFNLENFCRESDVIEKKLDAATAALLAISHELGIPQPGYPAPIANTAEIAFSTLKALRDA